MHKGNPSLHKCAFNYVLVAKLTCDEGDHRVTEMSEIVLNLGLVCTKLS